MKHYTCDKLNQILTSFDWADVMSCTNVDYAWLQLTLQKQILSYSILDLVAPVKEIRIKNRTEPWMSGDILNNIHQRDSFWLKLRKERKNQWK